MSPSLHDLPMGVQCIHVRCDETVLVDLDTIWAVPTNIRKPADELVSLHGRRWKFANQLANYGNSTDLVHRSTIWIECQNYPLDWIGGRVVGCTILSLVQCPIYECLALNVD